MITKSLFERCFPTKGLTSARNLRKYNLVRLRDELVHQLNILLPKYGINTPARVRAFLSCCGIETDYFKTTCEYASGADYEHRRDLGNLLPGDGRAFKGSSLIQTTGRYNFVRVVIRFVHKLTGKDLTTKLINSNFKAYLDSPSYALLNSEADRLGVNFLKHPEQLRENIGFAVEAACIFWQENDLNRYADAGQIKELNGVVNRGSAYKIALALPDRLALYKKLCTLIPNDLTFEEAENGDGEYVPVEPTPAPAPNATVTPAPDGEAQPIDLDKAQAGYDKASASLQSPSVRTLAKRAGIRLGGGLATVWGTTGGKIAIVLTGVVILSVLGGVAYSYRKQIQLGYQIAKATVKKALGGLF